jgi:hypothetical protein
LTNAFPYFEKMPWVSGVTRGGVSAVGACGRALYVISSRADVRGVFGDSTRRVLNFRKIFKNLENEKKLTQNF